MTRRCAEIGCGRFVSPDREFCRNHSRDSDELPGKGSDFFARLEREGYDAVHSAGLRAAIREAAERPGLTDEIGAIRIVLAKQLEEETDNAKLVASISRLASVLMQMIRSEGQRASPHDQRLAGLMAQVLSDLESMASATRELQRYEQDEPGAGIGPGTGNGVRSIDPAESG